MSETERLSYDFAKIEKKWQEKWVSEKSFQAIDFHPTKPKFYVLYEFFNISGNLHLGHLKGTVPADVLARYKRFCGYNVLFPIGGDSFGLPAENAAIKKGINPHEFVRNGMKNAMEQSKRFGLSFDWDRTICTSDPDYYKWTQWIFLQLLKHGKAYKKKGVVNFCPKCNTVLSNEDSQNGVCDRCGTPVVQKGRLVWFLKMQEYAEKLLGNVDRIQMPERLKQLQRNWIGRSEGAQVKFQLVDERGNHVGSTEIFTTCIETIFGVTFLVMAPENPLIEDLKQYIANYNEVSKYAVETSFRSEFDRISDQKEKTGCELKGLYAINPVNGGKVRVFTADFVLGHYGTGAVMAVPCHDQRDYDFAKAFDIPMIQVIEGDCNEKALEKQDYIPAKKRLMNSGDFSGMEVGEGKKAMLDTFVAAGFASKCVNYKMQDWPFNRQRYWGEPFPVVFCDKCGIVPLDEKDLPLVLPDTDDYLPNADGDSPLSKLNDWCNCSCPRCKGPARRETDTMPNWAGSSWYWLRYIDPHNKEKFADFEKLKYWGSVDCYTGGTEHITRHVLYSFFWQNFLYEIGVVPTRDPFVRKMGSGLILDNTGKKMSKSSTNGISPMEVIDTYGADAARLHVHFMGGYEDNSMWTLQGINGVSNFLRRVWNLQELIRDEEVSEKHIRLLSRLIKSTEEDIEDFKLNTMIASFMSFVNAIMSDGYITKEELRILMILMNPMVPHITSEIYERVFGKQILDAQWPKYDKQFLTDTTIEIPVQINGKKSMVVSVPKDISQEDLLKLLTEQHPDKVSVTPQKVIYVPNRIVNIVQ